MSIRRFVAEIATRLSLGEDPQTLNLMVQVAGAYRKAGILEPARLLLERAVRDIGRYLGQNHDLRLAAMAALRDLPTAQDQKRASVIQ